MTLRMKLDNDPYSLSQDELMSLKNNDQFNDKLEYLLKNGPVTVWFRSFDSIYCNKGD